MPALRAIVFAAVLLISFGVLCSAQALVEYAAGAAVGTAGSVGGKAVSDNLNRIFKKTDAAAQKATAGKPPAPPKQQEGQPQVKAASQSAPVSRASRPAAQRPSRPRVEGAAASLIESPAALPSVEQPVPAVPSMPTMVATAEEFARVTPGDSRQELVERLGAPSYRVRIQGDGHVQEIYRYSSNGKDLGTVRVVDGEVAAVKVRNN